MENFIRVYPQALSVEECDALVNDWDNFPRPLEDEPAFFSSNDIAMRNDSQVQLDAVFQADTQESQALKIKYYQILEKAVTKGRDDYLSDLAQNQSHGGARSCTAVPERRAYRAIHCHACA